MRSRISCAFALALAVGAAPAAAQAPASSGVPACDRYVAMVRSCLPRMCEEERALRSMELDFSLEAIAAVMKHKGREAAAASCEQDIARELTSDEYGCYPESFASRGPIRDVRIEPGDTNVSMTFAVGEPRPTGIEIAIAASLLEQPDAVYRIQAEGGTFAFDTAAAMPVRTGTGEATGAPVRLEPGTMYCYAIAPADAGVRGTVVRKGTFTTTGKRP